MFRLSALIWLGGSAFQTNRYPEQRNLRGSATVRHQLTEITTIVWISLFRAVRQSTSCRDLDDRCASDGQHD